VNHQHLAACENLKGNMQPVMFWLYGLSNCYPEPVMVAMPIISTTWELEFAVLASLGKSKRSYLKKQTRERTGDMV
jgi:hypothetical protein